MAALTLLEFGSNSNRKAMMKSTPRIEIFEESMNKEDQETKNNEFPILSLGANVLELNDKSAIH